MIFYSKLPRTLILYAPTPNLGAPTKNFGTSLPLERRSLGLFILFWNLENQYAYFSLPWSPKVTRLIAFWSQRQGPLIYTYACNWPFNNYRCFPHCANPTHLPTSYFTLLNQISDIKRFWVWNVIVGGIFSQSFSFLDPTIKTKIRKQLIVGVLIFFWFDCLNGWHTITCFPRPLAVCAGIEITGYY